MHRIGSILLSAMAAMAVLCAPILAADEVKPKALSLKECISVAMGSQYNVIVAENNIDIAQSRLVKGKSQYLPQLSIQNNAFALGNSNVLSQTTNGTALDVSQNIFDGGLREQNVLGARYGVQQNRAAYLRTKQSAIYEVTSAYYDVLRAKHLADVAEANVKYNEELRSQMESQAELGEAARVDVLPVEAQLANARIDYIVAQNAVRNASLSLQAAMGMSSKSGFEVQEIDSVSEPAVLALEKYIESALTARPDIAQSNAGLGAARASVKAARIAIYPRPVIIGDYQKSINGGFTQGGASMTGGFVFNLFDGGASRANYKEARAGQENAQQQAQEIGRQIRTQVEGAYLNLTSAKERLGASQASLDAAQKNLNAQKERYNQGLAITLDLLNADVQLVKAQSNMVQAKYDYFTAIAQMEYAVGTQGG